MAALRQLVSMLDPDDRELFGKLLRRIVALPAFASEAPAVSVGAWRTPRAPRGGAG